jgi:glutamate dehydrogenase
VDSILDLIVRDEKFDRTVRDRLGKDEVIFLGRDVNITSADIDWIINRATVRTEGLPSVYMNNFRFCQHLGVTSESVIMFLDVALRESLNINPTSQPFSVKITGGPDGYVAGHLIKALFREYGDHALIVGIADGGGVAEDPKGLNRVSRLPNHISPMCRMNS